MSAQTCLSPRSVRPTQLNFTGGPIFRCTAKGRMFPFTASRAAGPNQGLAPCVEASFGEKPQDANFRDDCHMTATSAVCADSISSEACRTHARKRLSVDRSRPPVAWAPECLVGALRRPVLCGFSLFSTTVFSLRFRNLRAICGDPNGFRHMSAAAQIGRLCDCDCRAAAPRGSSIADTN